MNPHPNERSVPGDMAHREEELLALEKLRLRCAALEARLHQTGSLEIPLRMVLTL